jgi:peptidoglycan/LPS O-acetylase OafA/YrhL
MKQAIIKPLHGIRGGAAMTVVVGHYGILKGSPSLGVVLFFVLSGFLIGKLYLERSFKAAEVWTYLVARFARIYPLFAFVVIGVGFINYAVPDAQIFGLERAQILPHLLLSGSAMTIWTICTEFQFYFLFVALWWLRQKVTSPLAVLLPVFLAAVAYAWTLGTDASRTDIFSYLHVFTIGLLISTMGTPSGQRLKTAAAIMLPIAVGLYFMVFLLVPWLDAGHGAYLTERSIYTNPLALGVCALVLVTCLAAGDCWVNRLLSIPPAIWLGEISFGIYLFHRPAAWLVQVTADHLPGLIKMPLRLGLTIACAQLAYWVIERPCRNAIRRLGESAWPQARVARL